MPIEAHGEPTVLRPNEGILDSVSDAHNDPDWLPVAASVEKTSDEPVGLGSTFVGHYRCAGRVELKLVSFERPHRATFRARSTIVDFDVEVTSRPVENRTRLDARATAEAREVMRTFAPLMARTMHRQFWTNWGHLGARSRARSA